LLLAAGKAKSISIQSVLHFAPERRAAQTFLNCFIDSGPLCNAGDAQAIGDIFVNRFRKWIRFLKDHSDAPAEIDNVHFRRVDVHAVEANCTLSDARAVDQIVHAINAPQQSRLAAA
jgi:hypothetical protein